jgi:hypothetical protein
VALAGAPLSRAAGGLRIGLITAQEKGDSSASRLADSCPVIRGAGQPGPLRFDAV